MIDLDRPPQNAPQPTAQPPRPAGGNNAPATADDILKKILGDQYAAYAAKTGAQTDLAKISADKLGKLLNDLNDVESLPEALGTVRFFEKVNKLKSGIESAGHDVSLSSDDKTNFINALNLLGGESSTPGTKKAELVSAIKTSSDNLRNNTSSTRPTPAPTDDIVEKIAPDFTLDVKNKAGEALKGLPADDRTKIVEALHDYEGLPDTDPDDVFKEGVTSLTDTLKHAAKDIPLSNAGHEAFVNALKVLATENAPDHTKKNGVVTAIKNTIKDLETAPTTTPEITSKQIVDKIAGGFSDTNKDNAVKAFDENGKMTADDRKKVMGALKDFSGTITEPDGDAAAAKIDRDKLRDGLLNAGNALTGDARASFLKGLIELDKEDTHSQPGTGKDMAHQAIHDATQKLSGTTPGPTIQPPVSSPSPTPSPTPSTSPPPTSTASKEPMSPSLQTGFDSHRTEKETNKPVDLDYQGRKEVHFEWNSEKLNEENRQQVVSSVAELQQKLAQNPKLKVILTGHCDTTGDNNVNDMLGLLRTDTVQQILIEHGIDKNRIQIVSQGKRNLEDPTPDQTLSQKNRSVTFNVGPEVVVPTYEYAPGASAPQASTTPSSGKPLPSGDVYAPGVAGGWRGGLGSISQMPSQAYIAAAPVLVPVWEGGRWVFHRGVEEGFKLGHRGAEISGNIVAGFSGKPNGTAFDVFGDHRAPHFENNVPHQQLGRVFTAPLNTVPQSHPGAAPGGAPVAHVVGHGLGRG